MIDQDLKTQLSEVFSAIKSQVQLVYDESQHEKQEELLEMLRAVAETSNQIRVVSSQENSPIPTFMLKAGEKQTGIRFKGIPGGHEFTSFVVAILNAAGLGKLPDASLVRRIKNIKAGLNVRTYISLSCENCPEVVQALNQFALAHGDFRHTMIDGEFVQEELARLNVQGVPSVFVDNELIHVGKATVAELLSKFEEKFALPGGSSAEQPTDLGAFDVVVVGGGPAGAAAAIYSVRKGLKTALIAERIGGQMLDTKGIENFTSVTYTEGVELSAQLDKHVRNYPVTVLEHRRVRLVEKNEGTRHKIHLDGGEFLVTEALIVATGAKWRELHVPGEKEYLGRGVAFCPHCDGPYYKGKRVAVIGGGNSGVEAAIDLSGICSHVTLVEFSDKLKADAVLIEKLKSIKNVDVVSYAKTKAIAGDGKTVVGLEYEDRHSGELKKVDLDGVFVQIGLSPNSTFVKDVVNTNVYGEIVVDPRGRTSTPGIYAAGDVTTTPYKQIVIAMGDGAKAALAAFEDRMRSGA